MITKLPIHRRVYRWKNFENTSVYILCIYSKRTPRGLHFIGQDYSRCTLGHKCKKNVPGKKKLL